MAVRGHAVAQLVEALRYKRIRFPKVSLEFFIDVILQAALGSIQPLTEMITRNMSWGKGGRSLGLTTLPPPCANCLEVWEPQPSGTACAWNKPLQGLPCLYFYHGHEQVVLMAWCLVLYFTDKSITSKNKSIFWGIYNVFLGIPSYIYCSQEHGELDWGLIQIMFNAHWFVRVLLIFAMKTSFIYCAQ